MEAALEALAGWSREGRRIAFLGDMRELGSAADDYHRRLGRCTAQAGVDILAVAGEHAGAIRDGALEGGLPPQAVYAFADTEALVSWVPSGLADVTPPATFLVKASRALGFERVSDVLQAVLGKEADE
jgi:UDP-N-acetylmuramoyl-tripeptide--D-alanyl-D-alanine ligase